MSISLTKHGFHVFLGSLATALLFFTMIGCEPDPVVVCTESITVDNTSEAMLYYPCDIANFDHSTGATTMMTGLGGRYVAVEWLSQAVAEDGYVVLASTPVDKYGNISLWRNAHEASIDKLKELSRTHPILGGKINLNKLQVMGYSKGGGGALWASGELGTELKSTIAMAPWDDEVNGEPLTEEILAPIKSATFIQGGGEDDPDMRIGIYERLPDTISRALILYTGAKHLAWVNNGVYYDRISQDVIAWMNYYLDGDVSAAAIIGNTVGTDVHEWIDLP